MLCRYSKQLALRGHVSGIVVPRGGFNTEDKFLNELRESSEIIETDFIVHSRKCKKLFQNYDVALALNAWSFVYAITCPALKQLKMPLGIGFYHNHDYLFPSWSKCMSGKYLKKLLARIKDTNILFYSEINRKDYESMSSTKCPQSKILPVAIPDSGPLQICNIEKSEKIIVLSIGRYTSFKQYPFRILDALDRSNDLAHRFEFVFYGSGNDEEDLKLKAQKFTNVTVNGNIDYSSIDQALQECHFFIGMGTSLTQAAISGKPCIVAVPPCSADKCTYGFYGKDYKAKFGIGDFDKNHDLIDIKASFNEILTMKQEDYEALCVETRTSALSLTEDTIIPEFIQFVESCAPPTYALFTDRFLLILFRALEKILSILSIRKDYWATKLSEKPLHHYDIQ